MFENGLQEFTLGTAKILPICPLNKVNKKVVLYL